MTKTKIWPFLAAFLALSALALPGGAWAETATFEDPIQGRFRLDYCRFQGQDCGIAAAFAYCQQEGYEQIVNYRGERDVANTQRIGDGSTCRANRGETCDGFESITCTREHAPPALRPGSPLYPVRPYTGDSAGDGAGNGTETN